MFDMYFQMFIKNPDMEKYIRLGNPHNHFDSVSHDFDIQIKKTPMNCHLAVYAIKDGSEPELVVESHGLKVC